MSTQTANAAGSGNFIVQIVGDPHARAPTEAITALAAKMPGVERQTHVRIGATLDELRQAPWAIRPETR